MTDLHLHYKLCPEKGATIFLPITLPNDDNFQNSVIDRVSNKFVIKQQQNIPSPLKCIATLPCEMFVLKNSHAPKLNGANRHAKLSQSKHLSKNIHPTMLAQFCLTDEKIFTAVTLKTPKNVQLYATAATKKKDVTTKRLAYTINVETVTDGISRRVTSG